MDRSARADEAQPATTAIGAIAPAASLTPLAVAALGLLNERAMHPYEMYQLMRQRHQHRLVKVRAGTLYHTVVRLAAKQLVRAQGTEQVGNRPERTTYAITDTGRAALLERVAHLLRNPEYEYPQYPFALSESHNLTRRQVQLHLRTRADRLDEQIAEIASLAGQARADGVAEAYLLEVDYLLNTLTCERDWTRRTMARIESKELAWPRPPR